MNAPLTNTILLPSTFSLKPFRTRTFNIILYPEWDSFYDILLNLQNLPSELSVLSPLHDLDVHPDGTFKKEHYHFYIKLPNAVWSTSLCGKTGLPHQYKLIEPSHNFRTSVRYSIHYDNPEKAQYRYEEIWTNAPDILPTYFLDNKSDVYTDVVAATELNVLRDVVSSFDNEVDFMTWCYNNGYRKIYRETKYQWHFYFYDLKHGRSAENK